MDQKRGAWAVRIRNADGGTLVRSCQGCCDGRLRPSGQLQSQTMHASGKNRPRIFSLGSTGSTSPSPTPCWNRQHSSNFDSQGTETPPIMVKSQWKEAFFTV
jgi:hypothetical protein